MENINDNDNKGNGKTQEEDDTVEFSTEHGNSINRDNQDEDDEKVDK